MLDMFKEWIDYLHSQGCYPEVAVLALGLYFICRWWLEWGPKRAQWVPIVAAFVGVFGYVWPHSAQDVIRILVQGGIQAGIAIGFYSFAEKRGWVDKIGEALERRLSKTETVTTVEQNQPADMETNDIEATDTESPQGKKRWPFYRPRFNHSRAGSGRRGSHEYKG